MPEPEAKIRYWAIYGQFGEPTVERVIPSTAMLEARVEKPVTESWNQIIPAKDISKLLSGYQAQAMEDKWNIYTDGPDAEGKCAIHMLRSWTGHKIVTARFVLKVGERGVIANEDSHFIDLTRSMDGFSWTHPDAIEQSLEVLRWVMGIELPVAAPEQ